ncbi:MAG: LCP family protein, partial [Clostridia bacterium]|nr:LCP family protein [Clostridia bacterium]
MEMMKRAMALVLALCLLLPCAVLAEDDEEVSLLEIVEEVELADEETDTADEAAAETDGDEEAEVMISDEAMESIEIMDAEIDESVDPDSLDLNTNLPDNVVNILLVGVDTRSTDMDEGYQHGDVQIICSINKDTGSVKLTSLQRDLYVAIPGYKSKNRINVAYARGGGELAMRTINSVFEMNIEYYVTINFYGLASIIDAIGGVDIEMTKAEAKAINTYLKKHPPKYDNQGDDYERVPLEVRSGVQHLDGIQAVMYARTR